MFSAQYREGYTTPAPWLHFLLDFNITSDLSGGHDAEQVFPLHSSLAEHMRIVRRNEFTHEMGLRPGKGSYSWTDEDPVEDQLPCICTRLSGTGFGLGDEVLLDDEHFVRVRLTTLSLFPGAHLSAYSEEHSMTLMLSRPQSPRSDQICSDTSV